MKVKELKIRKIFDSRGEPTIEICVVTKKKKNYFASVPSGKSTGKNEVVSLSFEESEKSFSGISTHIIGKKFGSIGDVDNTLKKYDSTINFSVLGGNVALGISMACARAIAGEKKIEMWELLRSEFFGDLKDDKKPLIFSNLINGGAHAENNLDIQEYMVVVRTKKSYLDSITNLIVFYKNLKETLKKLSNEKKLAIGDEGGYSLDFVDNFEPIKILDTEINRNGLSDEYSIGLDVAASGFSKNGDYYFGGKLISAGELADIYTTYFKESKLLCTIEDPFDESDEKSFSLLRKKLGDKWIVGDDITVTNPERIEQCAKDNLIRGVIIKPNQIGTITDTCAAITMAKNNNLKTIVSHRSGETDDLFIIHLAKAGFVDGVKIGAPARERIFKFNELARIFG